MHKSNGKFWGTLLNGEIEIRTLTEDDLEGALDILDKSFFPNESVCIGCEINLPENSLARQELRELCRITANDGISIVAKIAASGEPIAVSFNKIQYIPDKSEEPFFLEFRNKHTKSPQALCLMDFMISVDGENDVFEMFNIDCVTELMFLGTLQEWTGKGIARALAKYTIELTRNLSQGIGCEEINPKLRSKRPRAVTAIFTSQFSQKVGRAQGFKVLNSVPYTKFSFNGKTFDQRINPMHKNSEHVIFLLDISCNRNDGINDSTDLSETNCASDLAPTTENIYDNEYGQKMPRM